MGDDDLFAGRQGRNRLGVVLEDFFEAGDAIVKVFRQRLHCLVENIDFGLVVGHTLPFRCVPSVPELYTGPMVACQELFRNMLWLNRSASTRHGDTILPGSGIWSVITHPIPHSVHQGFDKGSSHKRIKSTNSNLILTAVETMA